jgi:PBP1b-binding outer membrane lipoprotein LpoB
MQVMNPRRLFAALALFLSGCAGAPQGYPSLAKRPIESAAMAEVGTAPATVPADPALSEEIARHLGQAGKGAAAFDAAYAKADRAVGAASGAAVSSDAWVSAQVAISSLEAARNDSVSALASLDTLYVQRSNAIADGKARGGLEDVDAARSATLALVDQQNDRIDAMKSRLPQP